jgi:hypothetical protein
MEMLAALGARALARRLKGLGRRVVLPAEGALVAVVRAARADPRGPLVHERRAADGGRGGRAPAARDVLEEGLVDGHRLERRVRLRCARRLPVRDERGRARRAQKRLEAASMERAQARAFAAHELADLVADGADLVIEDKIVRGAAPAAIRFGTRRPHARRRGCVRRHGRERSEPARRAVDPLVPFRRPAEVVDLDLGLGNGEHAGPYPCAGEIERLDRIPEIVVARHRVAPPAELAYVRRKVLCPDVVIPPSRPADVVDARARRACEKDLGGKPELRDV